MTYLYHYYSGLAFIILLKRGWKKLEFLWIFYYQIPSLENIASSAISIHYNSDAWLMNENHEQCVYYRILDLMMQ